jgi:hypothetical protein
MGEGHQRTAVDQLLKCICLFSFFSSQQQANEAEQTITKTMACIAEQLEFHPGLDNGVHTHR